MKIEKGKKAKDYCKRPCTSAKELHVTIREHSEKEAFIVKTDGLLCSYT